jgi:choline dehydrogenase-like flavoprotein
MIMCSTLSSDDVVVIGSGPAGAAASLMLANAGAKVRLLEAGLPQAARGLTARLRGYTVAKVCRVLHRLPDGINVTGDPTTQLFEDLAPGGLSNHWGCAVPRFSREDFLDARRAGPEYDWPLDYDDLVPWYERVEPWLHIAGSADDAPQLPAAKVRRLRCLDRTWAAVTEAARKQGRGILPTPYAYGAETTLTLSGTVFNSFVRLIKPALRAGRMSIRYGARATQLEWLGRTKRVSAVIFRDVQTGMDHRVPCKAVVVAAGSINTAKLLLQSTSSDFPDGLGNRHGVLGYYLHDHPRAKLQFDVASPISFLPPAYVTRHPLERSAPLEASACMQLGGASMLLQSLLSGRPGCTPVCGLNVFVTMAPSRSNFVALDRDKTLADGTPGLILNIHHPPDTERSLVTARDETMNFFEDAALRPRLRTWDVNPVGDSSHYAGTCRMHASPRFGMLDGFGRLHAASNVVVVDCSAFTTGPEKNPTLTSMALAARAGHRLAEDLRTGIA